MNVINYRVSLDMFDTLSQITIKAKKGDSACKIHITLTKNGSIYKIGEGCHATFTAKKADGNFVYNSCTIEGDTIVYDFTSSVDEDGICQISAYEGVVDCEVTLFKDNEQLTSPRFTLVIDGTVYNGEEIASTPQSDILKELINKANDTVNEIETKLANGDFKGEDGKNAVTDQTYNPKSENAQSGIAVAEALLIYKEEIVQEVLERLGGNAVFGYVDENNNIIVSGDLANGTYTVKYEMEDGSTVDIGDLVVDSNVYYSVTTDLTSCIISSTDTQVIEGESYSATISAIDGYELSSIVVTMGGEDVTSSAVSGSSIIIPNVTGNITITAVATETVEEIINWITNSQNADGSLYVEGKGYKTGYKLSLTTMSEKAHADCECVGFIPCKNGDTIYIKNIGITQSINETIENIVFLDANHEILTYSDGSKSASTMAYIFGNTDGSTVIEKKIADIRLTAVSANRDKIAYIRFSAMGIDDNSILTINQPIE